MHLARLLLVLTVVGCASKPPETEHLVTRDRGEAYTGITREEVHKVIKNRKSEVNECYQLGLAQDKNLQGQVVVHWNFNDKGNVLDANIKSSTLNSSDVETCLVNHLKHWHFPILAMGKEADVTYPFLFMAKTQGERVK